jgi:hypothetical protein
MRLDIRPAGTAIGSARAPYRFVVAPGPDAHAAREALARHDPTSMPIVWGDAVEAERLVSSLDRHGESAVAEILRAASDSTGEDILDRHVTAAAAAALRRERGWFGRRKRGPSVPAEDDGPPIEADGPLPPPNIEPLGIIDHRTGEPRPEGVIGLLPTQRAAEAAAFLAFGGWNACPPPHVHVALARDWETRYGARLIHMSPDVLEYEVSQPPRTREEALALAWVHYRYCNDTVDQLVGSIEGLAATLRGGRYWYFWWD